MLCGRLVLETGRVLLRKALDVRSSDVVLYVRRQTMIRRIDLPAYAETRWMHCRLGRTPDTASRLTIELPFHLPPQRRPTPGPGIVPIVTDADGRRLIRFAVPIGPDFTVDEIAVEVDSAARQVYFNIRAIMISQRTTTALVTRSLAVAKWPQNCCVGPFWPNITGKRYFEDIIL